MNLTDLNPRWVGFPGPVYNGVTFDCPCCRKQRLGVTFHPPIDPHNLWEQMVQPTYAGVSVWQRTGDTFETLTLTPSVDTSQTSRIDAPGHWHGFIKNGQVT